MNKYQQFYQNLLDQAKAGTLLEYDYDRACSSADWFYYMSDSNLSGFHMDCLREAAMCDDKFKTIFNRESAKRFDNESFYPADGSHGKYEPPLQ
jgi:hypothetical protein